MSQPVFRTKGLTKVYVTGAVEVHALRGVDFEAAAGEFVVMLGPSGSGKSTFLNIVGGLDRASGGEVWFTDHELSRFDDRELTLYRRDHVGFVFQFYNLVPSLTARENVALVTEIARDPMRPEDALAIVGLTDRMNHFPAASSSASPSPAPSGRRFCSATSRPARSIPRPAYSCLRRSPRSMRNSAPPR